jgi:hypothetical protein
MLEPPAGAREDGLAEIGTEVAGSAALEAPANAMTFAKARVDRRRFFLLLELEVRFLFMSF